MKTLLALLLTAVISQAAVIQHTGKGFYTTVIETGNTYSFRYTYDTGRDFTFPNMAYIYNYRKIENKVMFETFTSNYEPIWDEVILDGKRQFTWCPDVPEPSTMTLALGGLLLFRRKRVK